MIGKWLETQPEHRLDRFLECKMLPFTTGAVSAAGCLFGVAFGLVATGNRKESVAEALTAFTDLPAIWQRFNLLCQRLQGIPHRLCVASVDRSTCGTDAALLHYANNFAAGGAQAARLIRTRVLTIKARRALTAPADRVGFVSTSNPEVVYVSTV